MTNYAGLRIDGPSSFSFGDEATKIGDVNGDGIDDILVSSSDEDASYVVFGSDGLPDALDVADIDGTNGFVITNGTSNDADALGRHVAGMGDINGDGIDDFAIAGRTQTIFDSNPVTSQNFIYVIYGSNAGLPAELDVTTLSGANGFRIEGVGEQISDLENLGDVNGDGFDDLAISQRFSYSGRPPVVATFSADAPLVTAALSPDVNYESFVLFGGTDLAADGADGAVSVQDIDGTNGFGVVAAETNGGFYGEFGPIGGTELTALGDIDGDGFDDFLYEAGGGLPYYAEVPIPGGGAQAIVYGTDQGFGEALDLEAANVTSVDFSDASGFSYASRVYSVGDVNGDGFDDFAITNPGANSVFDPVAGESIRVEHGIVHVVYGSATGVPTTLSSAGVADASEGFSIYTTANAENFEEFGVNIASIGDVNGDGIDDFAITNPRVDVDGINGAGEVTVVLGNAGGFDRFIDINALDAAEASASIYTFKGFRGTFSLGEGLTALGDVNGDGIDDFGIANSDFTFSTPSPVELSDFYVIYGGDLLELADNADGIDDNVVNLANIDVAVTGEVPTTVSISDDVLVTALEGDTGTTQIVFTLRRDGDLTRDVSVDFDVTGAGLFEASGADFDGGVLPSGTVSFASGASTAELVVTVAGDTVIEASEDFEVTISNIVASGTAPATLGETTAFGRIVTDDVPPSISVRGDRVFEDNTTLDFVLTRVGDTSVEATITYDILPFPAAGNFLAADSADLGIDLPLLGGSVTFAAGQSQVTVSVPVVEDTVIEPRESIEFRITGIESSVVYDIPNPRAIGTITNDDGRPPEIPPGVEADVFGDPHIVTLDGLAYDFQAAGEYTLLESTADAPDAFEVQTRFEPVAGSDLVSVTTRAAVQTSAGVIEIDANATNPLTIDGVPTVLELGGALDIDGDGTVDVYNDGGDYQIRLGVNAEEYVKIGVADGFLNVCVFLQSDADGGSAGAVQGLMGNADGTLSNDFALRDGSAIPASEIIVDAAGVPSLSFDFLYGRGDYDGAGYAGSWAVGAERAFTDSAPVVPAGFPVAAVDINDLPSLVRAQAEQAAREAGLDPATDGQAIFDAAVLDFALTGNPDFLDAAGALAADTDIETDPFDSPELPATFSILQATNEVLEGDSGSQLVSFLVYRAGDDSEEVTLDYSIGGDIDEGDLASGAAVSGSVTFAAGETVKTVSVEIAGDTANEGDETLTVTLTPQDVGTRIATASASTEILTDDFAPLVVNAIADQTGTEDTAFEIDITPLFEDADGDDLTLTAETDGGVPGSVAIIDGVLTFFPDSDETGIVAITVTASDGNGGPVSTTFELEIEAVNDAPIVAAAIADQTGTEDTAFELDISSVFTDVDGDTLTLTAETDGGVPGSVLIVDGILTFFPDANENGTVAITVTADDGNGGAVSSTFNLTVEAENDAPIVAAAIADQTGTEDTAFELDISSIFADVDGDTLTLTAETDGGVSGSVLIVDGVLTFFPDANENGTVAITVTADDGNGGTVSTSFDLTIDPVNDGPVAGDDDGFEIEGGASVTIAAADLLANDTDVDGDTLSITAVSDGVNGTAVLDGNGDVVFTSDGTVGTASFTYTLSDGTELDTAAVSINVTDPEPENPYADYRQGTDGNDVLFGNFFSENQIFGAGGNDLIAGGLKDDSLAGGDGRDMLFGGWGDDLLEGNNGNDYVDGGWGADTLLGGAGDDIVSGRSGNDRLDGGAGMDKLYGGSGQDVFVFNQGDDHTTVMDFDFGSSSVWWWSRPGDKIEINVDGIDSFDTLMDVASQNGHDTVFDFGDGDTLQIRYASLNAFAADDFLF